jgi:hypothetical protein
LGDQNELKEIHAISPQVLLAHIHGELDSLDRIGGHPAFDPITELHFQ